ncbi:hypothetical protein CEXT_530471 [Caerostris extrusa]|uniref:Uncharacterized protein n=1 Tax=Caerostris extrusa TaxID=172846 RepID=A0AAV4TSK5_CAEEX|nr:hypothetical protein CEXT_530471 [Caerostris extrusa]
MQSIFPKSFSPSFHPISFLNPAIPSIYFSNATSVAFHISEKSRPYTLFLCMSKGQSGGGTISGLKPPRYITKRFAFRFSVPGITSRRRDV